jgi:hypothetical protein
MVASGEKARRTHVKCRVCIVLHHLLSFKTLQTRRQSFKSRQYAAFHVSVWCFFPEATT